jgi:hypothetical protein
VSVNKVAKQVAEQYAVLTRAETMALLKDEVAPVEESIVSANPVTEAEPLIKEEPTLQTGLALYEPSEQVETYKIAKTRKGFLGKLVGGIA